MKNATDIAKNIDSLIKESQNILVVGHNNPDPDALSSVISMYYIVKNEYGKNVHALCERIPASLNFMPGYSEVLHSSLLQRIQSFAYDLIIILDFNQWLMASRADHKEITEEINSQNIPVIVIDHHTPEGLNIDAKEYFHEEPTSTATNIHLLFHKLLGFPIRADVADHLLIGILADTNRFKYRYDAKSEATVLTYAAELVAVSNQSIEQISIYLDRIPLNNLQILQVLMKNIVKHSDTLAYATLSSDDISEHNLDTTRISDSATYFVNNILTYVDQTKNGFIIYPRLVESNVFTVRFRSNSAEYPVHQWATELGGGGHAQAAAAVINAGSIEEALEQVLEIVKY